MKRNWLFLLAVTALVLTACSAGTERVQPGEISFKRAPSVIEEGQTYDVQVWNSCGVILHVGSDWYLPDRRIAWPADVSAGFQPSDFASDWDFVIFEPENGDGPEWAILDAQVTRLNDTALEVTHQGTGDLIANFKLDPTPVEERRLCN